MNSKKAAIIACIIFLLCFAANFAVFVYGYNHLATPFLSEEQRVSNASFIMSAIVGAFAMIALLLGVVVYWALRNKQQKSNLYLT